MEQDVVFLDDLSIQRRSGDAKSLWRRTDDGAGFEQDKPVLASDVVGMNPDQVRWHFSSKQAHGGRVQRHAVTEIRITIERAGSIGAVRVWQSLEDQSGLGK